VKICYLVNQYPKVSHTFIRREIAALEQQGVQVERVSIRRSGDQLVDEADLEELARTRVILDGGMRRLLWALLLCALTRPVRLAIALRLAARLGRRSERGRLRNFAYLGEACVLLRWLARSGARHVHAHFGTNPASVAMLCHALGGPQYSFTVHGPEEFDKPLMLGLRDKIERAAFVVAISSFGRGQLYRFCDHKHWPKIHVVRCGLDERFLRNRIVPLPAARRIVCVGRLSEQKGHLLLVEAAARLAAEHADFELRLVGDGELRAEIEALAAEYGIADRVHVTGWASSEQVLREIEDARLVVLASFAEGLPVVIMEALAVGRTVLTTSVAGIPELVSPDCGWLVATGSVDELTAGLRRALRASDADLERMGRRGQARVRRLHDAQAEAGKLHRLFRGQLGGELRLVEPLPHAEAGAVERDRRASAHHVVARANAGHRRTRQSQGWGPPHDSR
jgi:glycosyltransferase involved in cell wall biosynthesis